MTSRDAKPPALETGGAAANDAWSSPSLYTAPLNTENIPRDLKAEAMWFVYKLVPKPDGKRDKVPYDPKSGELGDTADSSTAAPFDVALAAYQTDQRYHGVGALMYDSPFVGIDLDNCVDTEGNIEPWARDILDRIRSYPEITVSGRGIRIIARGTLPQGRRQQKWDGGREILFKDKGFVTITGRHISGRPGGIYDRTAELAGLHAELFPASETNPLPGGHSALSDDDVIRLIRASKQAAKFERLWSGDTSGYPSDSEADAALCSMLAFWTNRDTAQMERLFTQSGLHREKWERADYRDRTIAYVLDHTIETYQPHDGATFSSLNGKAAASDSTGAALVVKSMTEVESRPIEWLWQRWLARRKIHLLGGHAGEGKSLITAAIAARMSYGGRLLDGAAVGPYRTLFLLAEDDVADTVKPRLQSHHAQMEHIFFIEAVSEPDKPRAAFSIARHLPLLEQAIVQYGIDLLIIDPLSAFLQGAERNSEEVRDLLTPLTDLAAATNVAVLGIMHIGKPNGTNRRPLQQLLGATAFGAIARIVWMLAADDEDGDDSRRVLGVVKSNIAYKPASYALSISESGWLSWLGESDKGISELLSEQRRRRGGLSPERKEIIDLLNQSDTPLGPQEIADQLDKKISTVRNLLRRMEEDGELIRPRTGIYTTPSHRFIDSVDSVDSGQVHTEQESTESVKSTSLRLGASVDSQQPETIEG